MSSFIVFTTIALLFYASVAIKNKDRLAKACAICVAVSLTWIGLLVARWAGWFENDVLIALLLGESVVGGYYLFDRNVQEKWLVFRLPVLLTLSYLAYVVVSMQWHVLVLGFVLVVWLIHVLMYAYRNQVGMKKRIDKLIACCSRW